VAVRGERTGPHNAVVLLLPSTLHLAGVGTASDSMRVCLAGRPPIALGAAGTLATHDVKLGHSRGRDRRHLRR